MRSVLILLCCLIGGFAAVHSLPKADCQAQEGQGQKLKVEDVLKQWEFPKAEVHGPDKPKNNSKDAKELGHPGLASEWFTPKEPMQKVWKYYADKCGHEGKFPGPGAGVKDGTGNEKARYLMNFSGGSDRSKSFRCTFAYTTDHYIVFVELLSGWDEESTLVQVTAGMK